MYIAIIIYILYPSIAQKVNQSNTYNYRILCRTFIIPNYSCQNSQ